MHVVCILMAILPIFTLKFILFWWLLLVLAVIWCTPHALTLMIGCGLQIVNELPLFRL